MGETRCGSVACTSTSLLPSVAVRDPANPLVLLWYSGHMIGSRTPLHRHRQPGWTQAEEPGRRTRSQGRAEAAGEVRGVGHKCHSEPPAPSCGKEVCQTPLRVAQWRGNDSEEEGAPRTKLTEGQST
ncbi:unnamed protein product [Pleuronectes platessa]|uniref:Uncharacterized protein n=1 Tax=Pleuronectes platessa TaxID=8262 RepID=A0A9N7TVB8_PLEPL|nr:unnamed protein product [Pleuronectes platessa]